MLIRYKKNYEKIAMGLLSFMPSEKEIKKLQNTIKLYEQGGSWQLFLYKEEVIIGAVGIKLIDKIAEIHHLGINPSYRGQAKGKEIMKALRNHLGNDVEILINEDFIEYCEKCTQLKELCEDFLDPDSN